MSQRRRASLLIISFVSIHYLIMNMISSEHAVLLLGKNYWSSVICMNRWPKRRRRGSHCWWVFYFDNHERATAEGWWWFLSYLCSRLFIVEPFGSFSFYFWKTWRELSGEDLISVSNLPFFPLYAFCCFNVWIWTLLWILLEFLKGHAILTSCHVYIMKFHHPTVNSSKKIGESAVFTTEGKLCYAILLQDLCDLI